MGSINELLNLINPLTTTYNKVHDSIEEWNKTTPVANSLSNIAEKVVDVLIRVPGMTQAHSRDCKRATPRFTLQDGSVLKTWKNPVGVDHVFIVDTDEKMIFGGFVGWIHSSELHQSLNKIKKNFT